MGWGRHKFFLDVFAGAKKRSEGSANYGRAMSDEDLKAELERL
jgi:hypothetical protein